MLRSLPFIVPAQPTLRARPPAGDAWLHEVKFDGYRCQIHKARKDVVIYSRNGREFTDRFPGIREAVMTLPCRSAIIDGEVVVCNDDGTPNSRRLHFRRYADQTLCVWAFDLMELNGADLRRLPLTARKQKLGALLRRHDNPCVRYSEPFKDGEQLLAECGSRGLEGIVSKRKQAPYRSGKSDWVKVKCAQWKEANQHRHKLFEQGRRAAPC